MPHHPVIHPHEPGKVRSVLKDAAKFHGHSFNNALLTCPDLLQSLIHILFRFCQFPKAVSAVIEGMFLRVGVIPEDQPSIRFLWREEPSTEVAVFQYVRQIFRSKDSPTCANYALKITATDNADEFPKAAQSVQTNFYMEDYLESSPTAEEATKRAKDLVKLRSLGGFNITKFVSNYHTICNKSNRFLSANPTMINSYRQLRNHHTYLASNGTTNRIHLLLAEAPLLTQTEQLLNELSSASSPPSTTILGS